MTTATRSTPYTIYPGIAAEDLASDSVVLQVICPELSPGTLSGTVGAGITQANVTLKDRDGNAITSTATTANHIVATWDGGSNSRYAPLVRKGEPVEVFKRADQDKFYWREGGQGRTFRTTDRKYIEVGASDPTKPGQEKDDTNTYYACIDSDQKKVEFKTSKANGEVAAFAMTADLAAGTFVITDDSESPGNRIFMDTGAKSGTPMIQMNLSTGSTLQFNNNDIFIKLAGKFVVMSGERIVFDAPLVVVNRNKAGVVIINAASLAINTAADLVMTLGGVFGVNTAAAKISGVLVAAAARVGSLAKGAAGSSYTPATISDPISGSSTVPSNSADVTASPSVI